MLAWPRRCVRTQINAILWNNRQSNDHTCASRRTLECNALSCHGHVDQVIAVIWRCTLLLGHSCRYAEANQKNPIERGHVCVVQHRRMTVTERVADVYICRSTSL